MINEDYKNKIKRQLIDELSDSVGLEDKEILESIDAKIESIEKNVAPLKLKEKIFHCFLFYIKMHQQMFL